MAEVIAERNDDPGYFVGNISEFLFTLLLRRLSTHGAYLFFSSSLRSSRLSLWFGKFRLRKFSVINTLMATRPNHQGREKPGRWNE